MVDRGGETMKHIVDHPRTRSETEKLTRYRQMDLETRDAPSTEVEAMVRQPRERRDGEKLKRFLEIDRQAE
jgi:hypothetical protein